MYLRYLSPAGNSPKHWAHYYAQDDKTFGITELVNCGEEK